MLKSFLYLIFTLILVTDALAQQDTVRKEEVILSSELLKDDNSNKIEYRLKQVFKYTSRWERKEIFRVGLMPTFRTTPGDSRIERPGFKLGFRYDRKFLSPQFAIGVEGSLRLYGLGNKGHEYRDVLKEPGRQVYLYGSSWNHGSYFTNIFSANLYFKFFYQQAKRLRLKASGNNFTSPFLSLKLKDAFSFTRERAFSITKPSTEFENGVLTNISDTKRLMIRPAYLMLGWGIQRPFFGQTWAELHLGLGARLPGVDPDFQYFNKDVVYEVNLFIGLDFGKRKRLKND